MSAPGRPTAAALTMAVLLAGSGCNRLDSFTLEPGESYCGRISLGSQAREGLSPRVRMRLTFDAAKVEAGESPGAIWIDDAGIEGPALLTEAPLRPIRAVAFDALGTMSLGDGREDNLLYAVTATREGDESLLALLTMRSDDAVEVRLLRGGRPAVEGEPLDEAHRPIFGLFLLSRQSGTCGF
ncbi:MAG: hypothetical protein R3B72_33335 [Polyangiaceae bacterium]